MPEDFPAFGWGLSLRRTPAPPVDERDTDFPAFGRGLSLRQQGREYRQGSERRFPRLRVTMLR